MITTKELLDILNIVDYLNSPSHEEYVKEKKRKNKKIYKKLNKKSNKTEDTNSEKLYIL